LYTVTVVGVLKAVRYLENEPNGTERLEIDVGYGGEEDAASSVFA